MADVDLTDELKITAETPQTIKARLLADVNAGVDPTDNTYVHTDPGAIWDDLEGCYALETDRLYSRVNEVAAAAIPATTFGAFLDKWAESVGLTRKDAAYAGGEVTFEGDDDVEIPVDTIVSTLQTSLEDEAVTFRVTESGIIAGGVVTLPVIAEFAGARGNVPSGTITLMDSDIAATPSNALATTGGSDVEDDDPLKARLLRKLSGGGKSGNVDFYIDIGLNYPGVGFVTVLPNTPSVGHVTVNITDVNNDPIPAFAVDGLQAVLDPSDSPAQGAGLAPIGATIHVQTPTSEAVTVGVEVALAPGFTLTGDGGTQAVTPGITQALRDYINRRPAGGDVIRTKVIAAVMGVVGVEDLNEATLELNGSPTGNVAIGATEVAVLDEPPTITLTP